MVQSGHTSSRVTTDSNVVKNGICSVMNLPDHYLPFVSGSGVGVGVGEGMGVVGTDKIVRIIIPSLNSET